MAARLVSSSSTKMVGGDSIAPQLPALESLHRLWRTLVLPGPARPPAARSVARPSHTHGRLISSIACVCATAEDPFSHCRGPICSAISASTPAGHRADDFPVKQLFGCTRRVACLVVLLPHGAFSFILRLPRTHSCLPRVSCRYRGLPRARGRLLALQLRASP